jgi:septal ring-binding cell division protein DamX
MESINKVIEVINSQLTELESGISGKKSDIEKAHKEAISIADRTKKEALKEFQKEEEQIKTLKNTLKTLGVSLKPKAEKSVKPLQLSDTYSSSLTVNQKIAFALSLEPNQTKDDIAAFIAKEDGTDAAKVTKQISGILSSLKTKGLLESVKDGRKDKYSLVK